MSHFDTHKHNQQVYFRDVLDQLPVDPLTPRWATHYPTLGSVIHD